MTKKDYELIANRFRWAIDILENVKIMGNRAKEERERDSQLHITKVLAEELANDLQTTNPRFNRTKFLQACGIKEQ